jgi:hypothetical protein
MLSSEINNEKYCKNINNNIELFKKITIINHVVLNIFENLSRIKKRITGFYTHSIRAGIRTWMF